MAEILDLAIELIRRPSVTPNDAGCQQFLIELLEPLDFEIERLEFGDVDNLWARRGNSAPVFVFAGHTDVVPAGATEQWSLDPFSPEVREGYLFGRGAADMKGSLAAMVVACQRFIRRFPEHSGSLAFLVTSDEEGQAVDGTVRVLETLAARNEQFAWCLIGEPSSRERVGDVIKNGRRGSLHGRLRVVGTAGHVAYPHLANNPVHAFAPALSDLCAVTWDHGTEHFSPTGFQVTNMRGESGAENVIPGDLEVAFNFRFSNALSEPSIRARVTEILDRHQLDYSLDWRLSGKPFITEKGELLEATTQAIADVTGEHPELSTTGGTSDGRFIAQTGAQVVELGPVNKTIHKVDECVQVEELSTLCEIYERILQRLFA
jgi:succinyl-diaminopimelate desuccinylase